jgi:O-antigen/teichoic acid export membrane protein
MREAIFSLGKQSIIYGFGSIGSRLIAFLLLPLYTSYLTPADYGVLQICNVLNTVLLIIIQLGINSSLFKVYFQETCIGKRKVILSSTLIFFSVSSLVILLPIFILRESIAPFLIGGKHSVVLLVLVIGAVYFEGLITIGLSILRAQEKPKTYAIFIIVKIIIYALLNILFVAGLKRGYLGSREAIFITMLVCFIAFIPYFKKHMLPVFKWEYVKELLQIGVPFAIAGLAGWVLNFTDRYMLMYLLPEEIAMSQVGIYSLGVKFAMLIKILIVSPFMLSWAAIMFKYQHDANAKNIYSKVLNIYIFIACIIFIIISVYGKDFIKLITTNVDYYSAYSVIPFIALSYVLYGAYMVFSVGTTLTKKTYYVSITNIVAALLNVLLNYYLISKIGMMGAVISSLASFLVMTILLFMFSQKVYHIPYKIFSVVIFISLTAIFVFLVVFLSVPFLIKTVFTLLFISLLPLTGIVKYKEILVMYVLINNKLRRMLRNG